MLIYDKAIIRTSNFTIKEIDLLLDEFRKSNDKISKIANLKTVIQNDNYALAIRIVSR